MPELLAFGTIYGANGYQIGGDFRFLRRDGCVWLETMENFHFGGSPSPGWALLNNQDHKGSADLVDAVLNNKLGPIVAPSRPPYSGIRGSHRFPIPSKVDVEQFNWLVAWCYGRPELLGMGLYKAVDRDLLSIP